MPSCSSRAQSCSSTTHRHPLLPRRHPQIRHSARFLFLRFLSSTRTLWLGIDGMEGV